MRTLKFRSYDTIEQAYCPFITDHLKRDLYPHIDVQQWTGLLSKDGVEIYEGDILQGIEGLYEVKWNNNTLNWVAAYDGGNLGLWAFNEPEVIGNIWEHPELLEASQ